MTMSAIAQSATFLDVGRDLLAIIEPRPYQKTELMAKTSHIGRRGRSRAWLARTPTTNPGIDMPARNKKGMKQMDMYLKESQIASVANPYAAREANPPCAPIRLGGEL